MSGLYGQDNIQVFSWAGDNSLATYIANGTVRREKERTKNKALKDAWSSGHTTNKKITIEFGVAADTDCTIDFWAAWKNETLVRLIVTDDNHTTDGNFHIISVEDSNEDAIQYRVTAEMVGAPLT